MTKADIMARTIIEELKSEPISNRFFKKNTISND